MRISTLWYCLEQDITNVCRNILFSLALIATVSAYIFLFYLFSVLIANMQNVVKTAETTVGITVFLDEGVPGEQIPAAGGGIRGWEGAREARYISTAQVWENFKVEYFEGVEGLTEGFADDNPLSGSASYEIFLNDIEEQDKIMEHLEGMEGVREVRYSRTAAVGLTGTGKMVGAMLAVIICVLPAIVVSLISNTIPVTAAFRQRENKIMRLIDATSYMTRTPSMVEGVLLSALGIVVPPAGMYVPYQRVVICIGEHHQMLTGMFEPIPLGDIFPHMTAAVGCLGTGISFFVSYLTIHRHLKAQRRRM